VAAPDAGLPGSITLCASDAPVALFAQLGGTPDAGGAWSGPSPVAGGMFDPAAMAAGVYTYTISVPPPCINASSTVTVQVQAPPSAGSDASLTLCISSPATPMVGALGGSPDAGGAWSGPSPVAGGMFNPATMTAGVYTYTVAGAAPCPAASAALSVAVVAAPDAGQDAILNLCNAGGPVDLFSALGNADPGGSWTGPSGAPFNGLFMPGIAAPGVYSYTVAGIAPCPSASSALTIYVVSNADAGGDGLLSTCSSSTGTSLFNQLQGTPDLGGHWLDPAGAPFSGTLNAGTDLSGTYTYVVTVPLPCMNDTALVTVSIVHAPNAGWGNSITLCTSDSPISMIEHLDGTPDEGGSWTGPNGPSSAAFHPASSPSGIYTYTVPGISPCPDASAPLAIALNPMPNAGTDGSITVCPEAGAVDMSTLLGGSSDAGGSWSAPDGSPHGGYFDPSADPQGAYTYLVSGIAPCPNDQAIATVQVHVVPVPDAGPDAVSCTYVAALSASGTWASGQWSAPAGATLSDAGMAQATVAVMAGGAYTFTWNTISAEGCAGTDNVTITFTDPIVPVVTTVDALCHGACNGTASVVASGGNAGGTGYQFVWAAGSGAILPVNAGLCAGNYMVTVLDTNGCSATSNFTIQEPVPLVIDLLSATDELCPGSCDGTLMVGDNEGVQFSLNGGAFQSSNLLGGLCPGNYTVTMLDANGCSAEASAIVGSPPPVHAGFSIHPDTVPMNAPEVVLDNTSSANAVHFHWTFGDGGTSDLASPQHAFPMGVEAEYVICLTATTANGCPDTYCAPLPVIGLPGVYVPNAFTPDGDGRNDVFKVEGARLSPNDFSLMIFDRWGMKVFEAKDPSASWDGTLEGSPVPNDVYVWQVTVRFEGHIEVEKLRGHVTVVR